MITYEQRNSYIEDGSGAWEEVFRISDHPDGLLADAITAAAFTGSGLDDLTSGGTYTGSEPLEILIEIDGTGTPDTFKYSFDNGDTWEDTGIIIVSGSQSLGVGITIEFAATTGHTLADQWAFSVMGTANIFEIEDITNEIELETNVLIEDEMTLTISEAQLLNEENRLINQAALQFVLDAQDTAVKRYTAFFTGRPGFTLNATSRKFTGVILPGQEWDDISIEDDEWSEVVDAVKEWNITSQPFFENVFDDIETTEITDKLAKEWNPSTETWDADTTWRTANVAHRLGHWQNDTYIYSHFLNLINLNKVLKRFTDTASILIEENGQGAYTIEIPKARIDGTFRPTRYFNYTGWFCGSWIAGAWGAVSQCYEIPDDDIDKILYLGIHEDEPGGDATDDVSPFISYRNLAISALGVEPDEASAKSFFWQNNSNCKKFTDFLYFLALNFGMFLKMYFEDATTIKIEFVSRAEFSSTARVYIKDFIKSSGKIKPSEAKKSEKLFGLSFYLAGEGRDKYYRYSNGQVKSIEYDSIKKDGRQLLVTLSPTLTLTDAQPDILPILLVMPHNAAHSMHDVYPDSHKNYNPRNWLSPGQHTGIYMKVPPYDPGGTNHLEEPTTDYWTTSGAWNVNGTDYSKVSDYLNELLTLEKGYFERELNIECPFLHNFSASSDGSNPSWDNLTLGSQLDYNGKTYNAVSITRSIRDKTTSIKFHNKERFELTDAVSLTAIDVPDAEATGMVNPVGKQDAQVATRTAAGTITKYNIVTLNDDSYVIESRSYDSHYKKLYGMACDNYIADDEAEILLEGSEVTCDDWSFIQGLNSTTGIPGQRVFLKKDDLIGTNSYNMTVNPILEISGVNPNRHDLNACVGYFVTESKLKLDFSKQWIL